MRLYHRVISLNEADGMANNVDPDQTAVWSGSALFAQAYLSENLGSLRYTLVKHETVRRVYCIRLFIFDWILA